MKDQIQKLATLNKEAVDLLKNEDMEGAIAKHAEIQALTKEMEESADATPETTAVVEEKPADAVDPEAEIQKAVDTINKYASLNISADSIKTLIEDVASLKDSLKGFSDITKRLEIVEEAKGISKQAVETVEKAGESVWADLPIGK